MKIFDFICNKENITENCTEINHLIYLASWPRAQSLTALFSWRCCRKPSPHTLVREEPTHRAIW